jgi:AraC family transcriptional regulator
MRNADEAREGGDSRGVDRTARYVLDIIPESAGPRRATARGGVIHSIRGPGSQTFLAREHSAGTVLRPGRRFRASLGSDRITEYDAGAGRSITNCFSGERGGRPWVEFHLGHIRRPGHAA